MGNFYGYPKAVIVDGKKVIGNNLIEVLKQQIDRAVELTDKSAFTAKERNRYH